VRVGRPGAVPSEGDLTRSRQANDRDIQILTEALVARGFTPQAAGAFLAQFLIRFRNLAGHDSEGITHEHQATSS
jgi:hypothetical protein